MGQNRLTGETGLVTHPFLWKKCILPWPVTAPNPVKYIDFKALSQTRIIFALS